MSEPQSRVDGLLHIWELNPKTGKPMKWRGQWITDPKSAFEWMDKNGGRKKFVLNNVPPYNGRTQNPSHRVDVGPKGERTVGERLPRKDIPGKTDRAPMTVAAMEQALNEGKTPERPSKKKRQSASKSAPSREVREMQKTAKEVLDQHKQAEADELADEQK